MRDGWIVSGATGTLLRADGAGGVSATAITLTPAGPCMVEVRTPSRGPVPYTVARDATGVWLGAPLAGRMAGDAVVLCGLHRVVVADAGECWAHHQSPDKTEAGWTFRPWTVSACAHRVTAIGPDQVTLDVGGAPLTLVRRGELLFDRPPEGPLTARTEPELRAALGTR